MIDDTVYEIKDILTDLHNGTQLTNQKLRVALAKFALGVATDSKLQLECMQVLNLYDLNNGREINMYDDSGTSKLLTFTADLESYNETQR